MLVHFHFYSVHLGPRTPVEVVAERLVTHVLLSFNVGIDFFLKVRSMRDSIDLNELGTIALTLNNQPECRVRLMYMSLSLVETL